MRGYFQLGNNNKISKSFLLADQHKKKRKVSFSDSAGAYLQLPSMKTSKSSSIFDLLKLSIYYDSTGLYFVFSCNLHNLNFVSCNKIGVFQIIKYKLLAF